MPTNFYQSKDVLHPLAFNFVDKCKTMNVILNAQEINAVDFLTRQLVQNNLWDKFKAIYPFVGRSANSHSLNLKNTERHNIVWYNSNDLIHNNLGVTNKNIGYGNTMVAPSWFNDNDIHISIYNSTAWQELNSSAPILGSRSAGDEAWMHSITLRSLEPTLTQSGNFDRPPIFTYSCGFSSNSSVRFAGTDASEFQHVETLGYIVGVNGIKCYVNGEIYGREGNINDQSSNPINKINQRSVNNVNAQIPNLSQYPFLLFTNGRFTATRGTALSNIRFATIGYSMNDYENKILYQIVQKFQEILGRSVSPIKLKTFEAFTKEYLSTNLKINKIFVFPTKPYREYSSINTKPKSGAIIERLTAHVNISQVEVFGPIRIFLSDEINTAVSILSLLEI